MSTCILGGRQSLSAAYCPPLGFFGCFLETQRSRARSRNLLSWTAGCWDSFGRISHILHLQSRKCATSVNQGQAQGPKLLPQLEPLLSPQLSLLDLLLLRPVVPAFKENRPDRGPAPCVAGAAAWTTKALRTATSLRDRETG